MPTVLPLLPEDEAELRDWIAKNPYMIPRWSPVYIAGRLLATLDYPRAELAAAKAELYRTDNIATDWGNKLREWQEMTGFSHPSAACDHIAALLSLLAECRPWIDSIDHRGVNDLLARIDATLPKTKEKPE